MKDFEKLRIAVAGTGYVGPSIATLLAQHHKVTAVDVVPEKVEPLIIRSRLFKMNISRSIFRKKELNLTATLMAGLPTRRLTFVVIASTYQL